MRPSRVNATAEVAVLVRSRRRLLAIAAALTPETQHPAGEKAQAKVKVTGDKLIIKFSAHDSSTLRAIMSSYLRMLKATSNVCSALEALEPRRHVGFTRRGKQ